MKKRLLVCLCVTLLGCGGVMQAMTPEIKQAIELWERGEHETAFKVFVKYKDSDDADALAYLGRSYFNGAGTEKDYTKGYEYFMKAAEKGHPLGLNGVGVCLKSGNGVKQDLKLAEEYLLKSSQAGCLMADFNLGVLYTGFDSPDYTDLDKAFKHFKVSYDGGFNRANCAMHMGFLLLYGKEPAKGLLYLEEAARGDNPMALSRLADMYEKGNMVPVDRNRAIDYAERYARKFGDWKPYIDICYRTGLEYVFRKQFREGVLFLKLAADAGDVEAQHQVSLYHPDPAVRDEYTYKAYQGGCRLRLVAVGNYLAREKRYDEAMKVYLEAVKDGSPEAMCEIAIMYRGGEGVMPDFDKCMEWYGKAAKMNYSRGLRELGVKCLIKYQNDPRKDFIKGTHPWLSKAFAYIAMACLNGDDQPAKDKFLSLVNVTGLENLQADNSDMELAKGIAYITYMKNDRDLQIGLELIMLSAEHGNVDAMNVLGKLYFDHPKLKDLRKAADYYEKAASKGSDYAEKKLCQGFFSAAYKDDNMQTRLAILQRQSDKGYGLATCNLGSYYESKNEFAKAIQLYLKAAKDGDYHQLYQAINLLGDDSSKNEEIGELVMKGLDNHSAELEYCMGEMAIGTKDVPGDKSEARVLLMRAILDGDNHGTSYGDLGLMYCEGIEVKRDLEFAIQLLQAAVDRGVYNYCGYLGDALNGFIHRDPERAKAVYELGAKHGQEDCQERLKLNNN